MLERRTWIFVVLALTALLTVFSWLQPIDATQKDVTLDNAERLRRGIVVLREDSSLDRVAQAFSERRAQRHAIWHGTNPSDAEPWTEWGENVGSGPDVESVHKALMKSPDHCWNILHRTYNRMGAGVAYRDGLAYVTEIFVTRPRSVPFKAPLPYRRGHRMPRVSQSATHPPPSPPGAPGAPAAVSMLLRLMEMMNDHPSNG